MSENICESYNEKILQSIIDGTPYVNENPYPSRIEVLLMELKEVIENIGGTSDYTDLSNKPKINDHTLEGNQTAADLGLSTFSGSYTDLTDKPTLGAAAAKGVDSAPTPSSTNLAESGGVASAIAAKQDTLTAAQQAAADSGITAAKVSQYDNDSAALPQILNAGVKNLFNVTKETTIQNGVTFTNNGDGTVTSSGTLTQGVTDTNLELGTVDLPAGDYVFTSAEGASFTGYDSYVVKSGTAQTLARDISGYNSFTLAETTTVAVKIRVRAGHEAATFRPMICTKVMSDISGAFEPYAPTNRELYEMILAMQG